MATKIPTGSFTVLLFFAIVNMSKTATAKWDITEIVTLSGITGAEICKSGDIYNVVLCGPTHNCGCCTNWCNGKCRGMGSSMINQKCTPFINAQGYPTLTCECCCKNMSPPPPSPPPPSPTPPPPSPPPPPPQPFCCPAEMEVQVSPDQAPCKYTLLTQRDSMSYTAVLYI
ncbi:chitin-binding lectin 1-like [Papaver somniferum]|uniref:chitin-binding lectin 1-like n=1 Tax=Papaver somniferum TaxID=3469 RepID=UPI000E700665|nr:chitin-binding lectin 1-like [Papaver somniferum]